MLFGKRRQCRLNRPIIFWYNFIVVGATWNGYDFTGLADTQLFLLDEVINCLPFFLGPYNFFSIKFFIARFSIESSAYIFLSSACSASRSFNRFTSLASMPPYFAFQL